MSDLCEAVLSGQKPLLCYQCALAMSAMLKHPAPPQHMRPQTATATSAATAPAGAGCLVVHCRLGAAATPQQAAPSHLRITLVDSWNPHFALISATRIDAPHPSTPSEQEPAKAEGAEEQLQLRFEEAIAAALLSFGVVPAKGASGAAQVTSTSAATADADDALAEKRPRPDEASQPAVAAREMQPSLQCFACCGAYQYLDALLVPFVVFRVRTSPFVDSRDVSLCLGVPRPSSITWLHAATEFAQTFSPSGERPHRNHVVPEPFGNFKEFFCADLRARSMHFLEHAPYAPGADEVVDGFLRCFLFLVGRGSESVDAAVTCRNQLAYNEGVGITVSVDVSHDVGTDAIFPRLPKAYAGNKCELPVPYSVVYDAFPSSDAALVRRIRSTPVVVAVSCVHVNLYIIGRYCKYKRDISQSPWFTGGERIGSFSLQEIIAEQLVPLYFPNGVPNAARGECADPAAKRKPQLMGGMASPWQDDAHDSYGARIFGFGAYKFHSAGREDVDVRMLGTGRPFVIELISPHRQFVDTETELRAAARRVNDSYGGIVQIVDAQLRYTDAEITLRLAKHSESKRKLYRCVCYSSRPIASDNDPQLRALADVRDLELTQKTPLRVLHRRSLLARPRLIHSIRATRVNPHWLVVDVETQAGTYVKEFVHGDLGRTYPNLGTLLNSVTDIIQLDVLGMTTDMEGLEARPAAVEHAAP